jgi:hypothetical protein
VKISAHFQAILGYLLGADWTTPKLLEMTIVPKGHILARCEGQSGFSTYLGDEQDLIRNIP